MYFYSCVMLWLVFGVSLLDNCVNGAVLYNKELYRLDIVHYNDFHDRFEETSVAYPVCKSNDTQCLGGFPRLYQEIKTLLEEKPGALLLNAGDTFQGTYWYTLLKWNVTQTFINMLPNDAHVLVVTASAFTKYLGNLTAYFDNDGELQEFNGNPVFLNRSIPEDPEIKALLQPYKDQLYSLVHEVVGYNDQEMISHRCGAQECAIGNLCADAFMNVTLETYKTNLPTITFLLRNMIRGSLAKGEITRGSIINVMPFDNKVVTFVLQGKYVIEALERCLTNYWVHKPFNGPRMPQIAGIQLTLNTTAGKVISASVKDSDGYQPLDPEKDYQVITLDFLLHGGDGFTMVKNGRDLKEVGTDAHIFEEYIKKISPVNINTDNRLTIVN